MVKMSRLLTGARDGRHCLRFQIDLTNQMVFSIRDVERFAVQRHSLWTKETGGIVRSVSGAMRASSDCFQQRAVKFCHYDAIVIRISNEQPAALLIGEDFARKSQRQ